jgi:hypothetical protein
MTWIRSHLAFAISSLAIVVAICGIGALYSSFERIQHTAGQPTPIPTIKFSAPAPAYELTPALDATNPLENTEAVRTIRETYAASAWANLTNNNDFAQYRLYVAHWNSPVAGNGAPGQRIKSDLVPIGPVPFTPVSVTENTDGSATVSVCMKGDTQFFKPSTGESGSQGLGAQVQETYAVSPLTESERTELAAFNPPENFLRMRDTDDTAPPVDCSRVPVVTQTFANWKTLYVD